MHCTVPYMGQGANQAVEDGFVLAQCLIHNDFDKDIAFERYHRLRHRRVAAVVDAASNAAALWFKLPAWLADKLFVLMNRFHLSPRRWYQPLLMDMPVRDGKMLFQPKHEPPKHPMRKRLVAVAVVAVGWAISRRSLRR